MKRYQALLVFVAFSVSMLNAESNYLVEMAKEDEQIVRSVLSELGFNEYIARLWQGNIAEDNMAITDDGQIICWMDVKGISRNILRGILAHEIGHMVAGDGTRRIARKIRVFLATAVLVHGFTCYLESCKRDNFLKKISKKLRLSSFYDTGLLFRAGLAVTELENLRYSRVCETAADAFAVDLLQKKFNAIEAAEACEALAGWFEKMEKEPGRFLYDVFSTHPGAKKRKEFLLKESQRIRVQASLALAIA